MTRFAIALVQPQRNNIDVSRDDRVLLQAFTEDDNASIDVVHGVPDCGDRMRPDGTPDRIRWRCGAVP